MADHIERLSRPSNYGGGCWSYVVRRGGLAIELCVRRDAGGQLVFADGTLHRRAAACQSVVRHGETLDCELVGGPCDFGGLVFALIPLFEREAIKDSRDWLQPEAFWKALEVLL